MKSFVGKVVSNKMAKTVVVERENIYIHPKYKKTLLRHKRLKVHSDLPLKVGDQVKFSQTRPISKGKHFRVVEKIS